MPRVGRKRKKTRTSHEKDVSERETKNTPRCFVVKQGQVGDRVRELVRDFREVMMPNCAKSLRESRRNRLEDFAAVASHFRVSHMLVFSATKMATYMKLCKLPQGPTLTFKVDSFSLTRDVKAAQKRPKGGPKDYMVAPLQVLSGFGENAAAGAGSQAATTAGKTTGPSERALSAEMLRGIFPAVDVPTFNQAECRRAALFHNDRATDLVHFRHFSVSRRQAGLQRGVSKLLRRTARLPRLGGKEDIADFVLGGGAGASESEMECDEEAPDMRGGGSVAIRLSETGPRLSLLLVKAEEGVCGGGVLYHRFQTKTPSQREILEQQAARKRKLRERNARIEKEAQGKKAGKKARDQAKKQRREDASAGGEDAAESEDELKVAGKGQKEKKGRPEQEAAGTRDSGGNAVKGKKKKFHPFAWGGKASKEAVKGQQRTVELDSRPSKRPRREQQKGRGGKQSRQGDSAGQGNARSRTLERFKRTQQQQKG